MESLGEGEARQEQSCMANGAVSNCSIYHSHVFKPSVKVKIGTEVLCDQLSLIGSQVLPGIEMSLLVLCYCSSI